MTEETTKKKLMERKHPVTPQDDNSILSRKKKAPPGFKKPQTRQIGSMLTPTQKKFADHYILNGNVHAAAVYAGYSPRTGWKNLNTNKNIQNYIDEVHRSQIPALVAEKNERLYLLTEIARSKDNTITAGNRIQAMKLMAHMCGELVNKTEISGMGGGAIQLQTLSIDELMKMLDKV